MRYCRITIRQRTEAVQTSVSTINSLSQDFTNLDDQPSQTLIDNEPELSMSRYNKRYITDIMNINLVEYLNIVELMTCTLRHGGRVIKWNLNKLTSLVCGTNMAAKPLSSKSQVIGCKSPMLEYSS